MKVIFMGSPDFAVPALQAIQNAGHEVVCVYCQPPRPAGRGKKERPTPVHAAALALGLTVRHPRALKAADTQAEFAALGADIAVVAAYGLILPKEILTDPALGCVNIHASLLPRWRGAAPIHRAIMAGDAETGITLMQMDEGLDTGDMLMTRATPIGPEETTADLHDRLAAMGADMIVTHLGDPTAQTPRPQPDEGVTYAAKIDKAEARVRWSDDAPAVSAHIRGLSPFPGAWCEIVGERVKLLGARVVEGQGAPGQVLDGFRVACGSDAVEITRAQRAGRGALAAGEFLRGTPLPQRLD